jgi:hypothetical protein
MLGRARAGSPMVHFETGQQLVKRFKAVQQAKEEFWDRWMKEVFPSLLKQQKWFKYKRDAKVGDVVLRKDETAAGQTYKYARITKVHVGSDGKVRAEDIEYKVPGEPKFRSTTRPIHKLVLVVPVEEQTMKEIEKPEEEDSDEQEGDKYPTQGPGAGAGDREGRGEPEHEEENKAEPNESRDEVGQLAGAEANDDTSAKAQEKETATGGEKGVASAAAPKTPNVLHQDGTETNCGRRASHEKGQRPFEEGRGHRNGGLRGGHFPRSKQGECNRQRDESVHGPWEK